MKRIVLILLIVLATACTAIVDNTGRSPEVASATKTAVALLQPDFPRLDVQLFPNATDEGLLPTVTPTPGEAPCLDIKGNISATGEKIYHMAGQANYMNTNIDKEGEAYFCTEEEAQEAGFRKARR